MICVKLPKCLQRCHRECFSPFIYGEAAWVDGVERVGVKATALTLGWSRSHTLNANHMAGIWMHVETSAACGQNVKRLLRAWNSFEGRGYFHKGSIFPPIWFTAWLVFFHVQPSSFCHKGLEQVNTSIFIPFLFFYSFSPAMKAKETQ